MGTLPLKNLKLLVLSTVAAILLIPFYWMINTSLKSSSEMMTVPPSLFPSNIRLLNFTDALVKAPFLTYFFNTVIVALCVIAISTVISILAAFAFARLNFRGKNVLFFIILGTMMIPQEILIITNFMTISDLGWMNTWQSLILPYCINPFNIYLLIQTFKQVPEELYIASKVDGLSNLSFLRKVMLPLAKATVITTMILSVIWIWDTYAWPNLVTTKDSMRLVSNGLQNAFTTVNGRVEYELQMAAATLVMLPLILMFLYLKKYIFSGMMKGGVKG